MIGEFIMKTMAGTLLMFFLIFTYASITKAQSAWSFGDCNGKVYGQLKDVPLNRIGVREYSCRYGWRTVLIKENRDLMPQLSGNYAIGVENFLTDLSNAGYYTVNIITYTNYGKTGWYIKGSKNWITEKKQAEKQAYQNQQRQQSYTRSQNSSTKKSSTKSTSNKSTRKCSVHLYSSIFKTDSREKEDINLAGEYINVIWEPTHFHAGQAYSNKLFLQDINGNKRELTNGQNWVAPGRYQLYIRYSNIISTAVTVEYDCY